jgi:hypothetical protein
MKTTTTLALLLATTLTTSACAHPRSLAAGAVGAAGIATVATGVGTYAMTGGCDGPCPSDDEKRLVGAAIAVAGAAVIAGAYLLARSDSSDEAPPAAVADDERDAAYRADVAALVASEGDRLR